MMASEIARAPGGTRAGASCLIRCRVPSHGKGRGDRNPSVTICDGEVGLLVFCHAGCDRLDILRCLCVEPRRHESEPPRSIPSNERRPVDDAQFQRLAVECWRESRDPRGTIVEAYLRSRGLELPPDVAGEAIRFHPACAWREDDRTIRCVPAMVAAMRSLVDGSVVGVHRTRLSSDGQKVDRRMLATAGAIMLDVEVGHGLFAGEGIETCLAGRQLGLRPTWALRSAGAIKRLPVLAGIDALTIFRERDDANGKAAAECASRWHAAGREVAFVFPRGGKDLNDALRAEAA